MIAGDETPTRPWRHQVLLVAEGDDFLCRLEEMDSWLERWKIMYRVVSVKRDEGAIRICFREASLAHAFHEHLGGKLVPPDPCAVALAADPLAGSGNPLALRAAEA
ncbi:hypothetical protein [Bosea sp. BIWAKO-01]|uniref:hypothetical protein n=1 Tax=Bosea sp. BIWAKO-01 TaxID=506668 RepID=UPI00085384AF|nr:hypothetical protein [Bosea sp. BIWAKO-01]GAU85785.1 hypothetical protein BIWAKO_05733 [Bosea sp. BIWAKO-01]